MALLRGIPQRGSKIDDGHGVGRHLWFEILQRTVARQEPRPIAVHAGHMQMLTHKLGAVAGDGARVVVVRNGPFDFLNQI